MAKPLTALAVKNARADANRRREIADGRGLYLVVQPSGAKSWAYRYRFEGRPVKLTLGAVYLPRDEEQAPEGAPELGRPLTLAQARLLMADIEHKLSSRKVDPAATVRAKRRAPVTDPDLFDSVAVRFLTRYPKTPSTRTKRLPRATTYREVLSGLGYELSDGKVRARSGKGPSAAAAWGTRRIADVERKDVNALLDDIGDARGEAAADKARVAIRLLFNWGVERDIVAKSPAAGVRPRLSVVKRDRELSDDELRLVWRASEKLGWPFGHLVKLLALTGCRRDEWAEARWSEVDLRRAVLTIPAERSKNGFAHTVPLSPQALDVLAELDDVRRSGKPDWIFTTGYGRTQSAGAAGTLQPISGFSKAKTRLDELMVEITRADAKEDRLDPEDVKPMPAWRFHDLRRTAVTGMAKLKVPLEVIERAVNHVSGSFAGVVGVYQRHSYSAEVREALESWGCGVERVARGEPLVPTNVVKLAGRAP